MLRLLQVFFRDNFKDDFKTTILNSTQLGTTQPQLVYFPFCLSFCIQFSLAYYWSDFVAIAVAITVEGMAIPRGDQHPSRGWTSQQVIEVYQLGGTKPKYSPYV